MNKIDVGKIDKKWQLFWSSKKKISLRIQIKKRNSIA